MSCSTGACNILYFPDEILLQIILSLNLRDRLPLAYSCTRLKTLVFDDNKASRNLDFSEDGYLTTISDVKHYFSDKKKCQRIQSLNLAGIYCPKPAEMLKTICEAKNLVELDVSSVHFGSFKQFANFLQPLERLRKLSTIWPTGLENESLCLDTLYKSLRQITHLSVTLCHLNDKWHLVRSFRAMVDLEELRVVQIYTDENPSSGPAWLRRPKVLHKLRLVACLGIEMYLLKPIILVMMPNPEQWMQLIQHNLGPTKHSHCENDIQISALLSKDSVRTSYTSQHNIMIRDFEKFINFTSILEELLRISKTTNLNKNEGLSRDICADVFLPRIQDIKLLVRNPNHPIHYMNLNHSIDSRCYRPLVLSMFPSLTELVISNIMISNSSFLISTTRGQSEVGGIKRKYEDSEDEHVEPGTSCFRKIVENSPNVKALTITAGVPRGSEMWDFTALRMITGWRSLTSLHLEEIPIKDGQFLVEIGAQCINLEKIRLVNLGPEPTCCYTKELTEMLTLQRFNLKDFSIEQSNLCHIPRILDTLAEHLKLRRVCIKSLGRSRNAPNLIRSIHGLIRSCKLILFVCEYKGLDDGACDELISTLQSLKIELNRPRFQFDVIKCSGPEKDHIRNFDLHYIHKDLLLPFAFVDSLYRLNS